MTLLAIFVATVTITSYQPVVSQTDSSPTWTSIGDRTTKYGVAAWTLYYPQYLSLNFWVLVWVLLLVIELLRKSAQFYIPARWENVSLKLDSEHFWLIHLIILGTATFEIWSESS